MVPPIRDFEDRGVRWLLDSPTNVQGILTPVAADIASRLDYARMEHIPRSFVPDDLRKREADVIFRSPYRSAVDGVEQTVLVFLLLEHQSTVDPMMGFRLLVYMVAL